MAWEHTAPRARWEPRMRGGWLVVGGALLAAASVFLPWARGTIGQNSDTPPPPGIHDFVPWAIVQPHPWTLQPGALAVMFLIVFGPQALAALAGVGLLAWRRMPAWLGVVLAVVAALAGLCTGYMLLLMAMLYQENVADEHKPALGVAVALAGYACALVGSVVAARRRPPEWPVGAEV